MHFSIIALPAGDRPLLGRTTTPERGFFFCWFCLDNCLFFSVCDDATVCRRRFLPFPGPSLMSPLAFFTPLVSVSLRKKRNRPPSPMPDARCFFSCSGFFLVLHLFLVCFRLSYTRPRPFLLAPSGASLASPFFFSSPVYSLSRLFSLSPCAHHRSLFPASPPPKRRHNRGQLLHPASLVSILVSNIQRRRRRFLLYDLPLTQKVLPVLILFPGTAIKTSLLSETFPTTPAFLPPPTIKSTACSDS